MNASTPAAATALDGRARREPHAGIPILDEHAKVEYQRRLNELRQELNEAERFKDPQRKAQAQNEVQAIADYLASAVGLGGRDRKTSSDAERARLGGARVARVEILNFFRLSRIVTRKFTLPSCQRDAVNIWPGYYERRTKEDNS